MAKTFDNRAMLAKLGRQDQNRRAAFVRRLQQGAKKPTSAVEAKLDKVIELLSAQGESTNGK